MPKLFNGFNITEDQQASGAAMMSLVDGISKLNPRFQEVYQRHHLHEIKADKWYSLIAWLDALHEIREMKGGQIAISQVARLIPAHAAYPPEISNLPLGIEPLEIVIQSWDVVYKMNQTGDNIGGYEVETRQSRENTKTWVITECVPFPAEIGLGVGYGFCTRFLDKHQFDFKVFNNVGNTGMRDGQYVTEIWITVTKKTNAMKVE